MATLLGLNRKAIIALKSVLFLFQFVLLGSHIDRASEENNKDYNKDRCHFHCVRRSVLFTWLLLVDHPGHAVCRRWRHPNNRHYVCKVGSSRWVCRGDRCGRCRLWRRLQKHHLAIDWPEVRLYFNAHLFCSKRKCSPYLELTPTL